MAGTYTQPIRCAHRRTRVRCADLATNSTTAQQTYITTVAPAIQTRDTAHAGAWKLYDEESSTAEELYQQQIAQANRNHAVAMAQAERNRTVTGDQTAYDNAVAAANSQRNAAHLNAARDYAIAEIGAKGGRDITLHNANTTLDATEGTAHVTRTQDVTSAIRDAQIADAAGYRDMYLNVLSDLDDFGVTHANERVTELTNLNTTDGTPWAGQALGKGVAESDYATTLQPINLANRQTSGNAQVDYTTSEANAWHAKVNTQTQSQATLRNDQGTAKGTMLAAQQNGIQAGVNLGIRSIDATWSDPSSFAITANITTQAPTFAASTASTVAQALPSESAQTLGAQWSIPPEAPPTQLRPTATPLVELSVKGDFHETSNTPAATGAVGPISLVHAWLEPEGTLSLTPLGLKNGNGTPLNEATDTTQGVLLKVKHTHKKPDGLDPDTALADGGNFSGLVKFTPGEPCYSCHPNRNSAATGFNWSIFGLGVTKEHRYYGDLESLAHLKFNPKTNILDTLKNAQDLYTKLQSRSGRAHAEILDFMQSQFGYPEELRTHIGLYLTSPELAILLLAGTAEDKLTSGKLVEAIKLRMATKPPTVKETFIGPITDQAKAQRDLEIDSLKRTISDEHAIDAVRIMALKRLYQLQGRTDELVLLHWQVFEAALFASGGGRDSIRLPIRNTGTGIPVYSIGSHSGAGGPRPAQPGEFWVVPGRDDSSEPYSYLPQGPRFQPSRPPQGRPIVPYSGGNPFAGGPPPNLRPIAPIHRIPNYPNTARPGWLEPWTPPPRYNGPVNHGRWVNPDGTPGVPNNSLWISTRQSVIDVVGQGVVINGVQYSNPIVFHRGVVDFSPWAVGQPLRVPGLVGTAVNSKADQALIYRAIAEREGLPNPTAAVRWLRNRGLTAHHTGGETVILVPRGLHTTQFGGVQHTNIADLPP